MSADRLFFDQKNRYHAWCPWCLLAATTTLITVPLAIPEASVALRRLFRKK